MMKLLHGTKSQNYEEQHEVKKAILKSTQSILLGTSILIDKITFISLI